MGSGEGFGEEENEVARVVRSSRGFSFFNVIKVNGIYDQDKKIHN